MKILYDHQIFSLQDAGGASRYFYELVRHLSGHDSTSLDIVMGFNNSVYPFRALSHGSCVVSWRSALAPGLYRYAVNELLSNSMSAFRGRFDIYHSTLYRALPLVSRRKLVATHHDSIHEIYPELFRNARSVIENKKRLYAAADAIICVSESSRQDLLRFYSVDESRTHVIHHGFSPFRWNGQPQGPSVVPYVLYVGARGTYKNFTSLLDAFANCSSAAGYELRAVGGGGLTAAEDQRIRALGIEDRVKIFPLVSDDALARAYAGASLFVYPSMYEGFGFPPLEAMSMGCPVLTAKTSSMPEICGDAAFYFDPHDPNSLGEMLRTLLASPDDLSRLRESGFRRASLYRWEDTAARTLQLYLDALAG